MYISIGVLQFLAAMTYAEWIYPNYNNSINLISDLGIGETALIFNASAAIAGLALIAIAYLTHKAYGKKSFSLLILLFGIGMIGVGAFPINFDENIGFPLHDIFSSASFVFGSLSAVASYNIINEKQKPLACLFILLGIAALVSLGIFSSDINIGIGAGAMERMIVYPIIIWAVLFGSYLVLEKAVVKK